MNKNKLILIFTSPNDFSTNDVILWIHKLSSFQVKRIFERNMEKFIFKLEISKNSYFVFFKYIIHSLWFRKGFILNYNKANQLEDNIKKFFLKEIFELKKTLYDCIPFSKTKVLGTNKLDFYDDIKVKTLIFAKDVGLNIPETIISSSKKNIYDFAIKHSKIVAKPIKDPEFLQTKDYKYIYMMYTKHLNVNEILNIPNIIFPCILQEYIEKIFDIRIFFIERKFFSAIILSQEMDQTKEDFRNYQNHNSNRIISFSLPKSVEKRLVMLINKIGLNTGSIDMIMSKDGDYYFLEINPVGQFEMISKSCNYNIEKEIANYLIEK